ncbi:MAG: heat-inducible transcription repressor HrcA [Candidatus Omnitrophica bacterium]|nr:heat-inducible transcription repressor HrcA [Candidatus Omnitrophota bacterium]
MKTNNFESRKEKILELIIENYINSASPISSRAISSRLHRGLSSATIRNVMADLEDAGFIMHPHTSAGRVPTEKGYRYYVDKLMRAKLLTEEEKKAINKEFKACVNELDALLDKASHILSSITNQTGIVLFPMLQKGIFSHADLIRLNSNRLLIVLMTESGLTEDFIIDMKRRIEDTDLTRIANFINSQIGKGSIEKIRKEIMQRLLAERDSFFYVLDNTKRIIDGMLGIIREEKIYLGGAAHIVEQPEFRDAGKIRNIFKILENNDFLSSMLKKGFEKQGVNVYIGSELDDEFAEFGLVTCNYCIGDIPCGTLGVIGPARMEYARLISVVGYVASSLNKLLSDNIQE